VIVPDQDVSLEDYLKVVDGERTVRLTEDSDVRESLSKGFEVINDRLRNGTPVYGVNTGVGESGNRHIPSELLEDFPEKLVTFHGCGTGDPLPKEVSLGIVFVRLISLSRGSSAVRVELLEKLCELINQRIIPVIPEEGSVGASGDLTPLSYLAAVLMGNRKVWDGEVHEDADDALRQVGIDPLELRPKESLALMNGTAAMTALTLHCLRRSDYLLDLTATMSGLASYVLDGNPDHFDARIFKEKNHPGQYAVAQAIRKTLNLSETVADRTERNEGYKQDRYSLRCAPHILGVLADALPWMKEQMATELNGVDDNPLVDVEQETILHGGNFYGGHVAFVADSLKNTLANMADLMDRQFAQLVDPKLNDGLPENLVGVTGQEKVINHGFKALQIASSAWSAEAQKLATPGSVHSRSTESHNQDKVSMGSISSRDARDLLQLTEKTVAANLLALTQALDIRLRDDELEESALPQQLDRLREVVRGQVDFLNEDRELDKDLEAILKQIRNRELPVASVNEVES
jgi:histidine ammonia-lyase